jgi:nitronate monooxygenase
MAAAGGIADGRGLAAALMLGAAGVLMATRFHAAEESLLAQPAKMRIVHGAGDDTLRTKIFDIAVGGDWPQESTGRVLRTG